MNSKSTSTSANLGQAAKSTSESQTEQRGRWWPAASRSQWTGGLPVGRRLHIHLQWLSKGARKIHITMKMLIAWKITFGSKCQTRCAEDGRVCDGYMCRCTNGVFMNGGFMNMAAERCALFYLWVFTLHLQPLALSENTHKYSRPSRTALSSRHFQAPRI